MSEETKVLKNHAPSHLKPQAGGIACMRLLNDAIGNPFEIMLRKDSLKSPLQAAGIPTVWAILNEGKDKL